LRIVPYTNVILAGFAVRGLCAEVVKVCISSHTLFISEYILTEIKEALLNKVKLPKQIVHGIVSCLKHEEEMLQPAYVDSSMCQDRRDLSILSVNHSGNRWESIRDQSGGLIHLFFEFSPFCVIVSVLISVSYFPLQKSPLLWSRGEASIKV
jgi:hypothetical protein